MASRDESTALDSGVAKVCTLKTISVSGSKPKYHLSPYLQEYFGERFISYSRQYLAKGANEKVDFVIRIQNMNVRPSIGQYAILLYYDGQENPNGDQFRITNVQPMTDADGLKVYDLSLERLDDLYEIVE